LRRMSGTAVRPQKRSAAKRGAPGRRVGGRPPQAAGPKTTGTALRETYRAFARDLSRRLQPHGVTLFMWFVLRVLWTRDGLSQVEIARAADRQASAIVNVVRALQKARLVRVSRSAEDGRLSLVRLTTAGRDFEPVLTEHSRRLNQVALRGFTRAEQRSLMDMLERLQQNIRRNNEA
jgi:MarR family transcriptional regulator, organic hydroperoxide resistance regulator